MKNEIRNLTSDQIKEAHALKKMWEEHKVQMKKRGIKFTQESAMAQLGFNTQGAISQYLNGKIALNVETILKFSKLLNRSPTEIRPSLQSVIDTLNTQPTFTKSFKSSYGKPKPVHAYTGPKQTTQNLIKEPMGMKLPVIPWHDLRMFLTSQINQEDLETMAVNQEYSHNAFYIRAEGDAHAPYLKHGELALVEPMENTLGQRVLIEMNGQFYIMEHCIMGQQCFLPKREGARQIDITADLQYTIHGVIMEILNKRKG